MLQEHVYFEFCPLRFHFAARDSIQFPSAIPANILRGAFGAALKRIAGEAVYGRIFDPESRDGPSGLAHPPRPFVFRARHLEGCVVAPGEIFHFGVNVFDIGGETVFWFRRVFAEWDWAKLERVDCESEPTRISLIADPAPARKIRVEFLTPTELKSQDRIAVRPEFSILFARIRDRLSTLSAIYGRSPLAIDFAAMGERAAGVRLTHCDIRPVSAERRSGRSGHTHPIGGFIGSAGYEGELREFLPYLEAARWTGVGRQTVWGNGEIIARIA